MQDFNAVAGILTTPLWAAVALLVLLLVLVGLAVRRYGSSGSVAALFGVPALIVIAWAAWNFADQAIVRQRMTERDALNTRALQLTTTAMAPGSPLACLGAGAGDTVEDACEAALFARPETVAAAAAYTEARLRLLAESLLYSWRVDKAYSSALAQLRRTIEADRYGFVAHIFVTRDGCTADGCESFWLLDDANAVKENIRARTLETNIARHAASWGGKGPSPAATARTPTQIPPAVATFSAAPVTRPIDFPSAASIPPVSIMTEPPPFAPPPPAATMQAPPSNRPAAPAASVR